MLSKSLGQILRVAVSLHVMFHFLSDHSTSDDYDEAIPNVICEQAIIAAIDFVEYCCQHTAFIACRGNIDEEIKLINAGKVFALLIAKCILHVCVAEFMHINGVNKSSKPDGAHCLCAQ